MKTFGKSQKDKKKIHFRTKGDDRMKVYASIREVMKELGEMGISTRTLAQQGPGLEVQRN